MDSVITVGMITSLGTSRMREHTLTSTQPTSTMTIFTKIRLEMNVYATSALFSRSCGPGVSP